MTCSSVAVAGSRNNVLEMLGCGSAVEDEERAQGGEKNREKGGRKGEMVCAAISAFQEEG